MKIILCWLRGHDWRFIGWTDDGPYGREIKSCLRCSALKYPE